MKHETKINRWLPSALTSLGVALLLLAGFSQSQAQIPTTNIINTFDTAPASGSGNGIGNEWGTGSWAWDGVNGNPPGAAYYTASWDPTSDTPLVGFACEPNGNPWYVGTPINLSSYLTLEFDIKWDNTSDITIDQFNNVETWPFSLTNAASAGASVFQSWATTGGAALVAGGNIDGLEVDLCGGPGGQNSPVFANFNIPAAASNGWVHVSLPINQAQAQIDGISGIVFHKWTSDTWTLATNVNASFWIDNLEVKGTTAPPPPPTMSGPTRPVHGLNVFSSTQGNSYYDRQEILFRTNTALSWIGRATPANPVTYSFSIVGYPNSVNCEAYMFLSPNGSGAGAPDWNDPACVIVEIQGSMTNALMSFNYKVNEPNAGSMQTGGAPYTNAPGSWDGVTANYYESGQLGGVTNGTVLGLWKVQFTSDTNITLIAPNGNTSSLVLPPYNAANFADTTNFNVYLGMQANQADGMNQAVVYSNIGISGVPSAYSENFMTDAVLDTTNVWNTSVSGGPAGILIISAAQANSGYWVSHTLPDTGWSLCTGSSLVGMANWASPSIGPVIPMAGLSRQLVNGSELPAGGTAFFNMIQRTYTQLQVLLPGQTNAPGTALGYVGTPTPISLAAQGLNPTTITVNACDATWHIVGGVSDNIALTTSDGGAYLPDDQAMVNGTASFTGANGLLFGTSGSQTVTAADLTSTTVTNSATSAAVTINP